jgi:hypothetical protein
MKRCFCRCLNPWPAGTNYVCPLITLRYVRLRDLKMVDTSCCLSRCKTWSCPCCSIKHHATKAYTEWRCSSTHSGLDGGEWPASRPCRFFKLSHYTPWRHLGERRYSTSALNGGWVVSVTPRPRFTPGKGPLVPIVQEAGLAPEPFWTQRLD